MTSLNVLWKNGVTDWAASRLSGFARDWTRKEPFDWRALLACLIGGVILWPLVDRLPVLGMDWYTYFYPRVFEGIYPPWTGPVLTPFVWVPWRASLSLMNSLMLVTVAVATAREARRFSLASRLGAVAMATTAPTLLMLLWQGNVDGLVLLGLVALPPGVVLALIKPTIAGWALLARRQWTLWAIGFGVVSLVIWGWWPGSLMHAFDGRFLHPMAMGWHNLGWPVALMGLILLAFTNADPMRLMAAGSFLAPYVMPNHYLLFLPALGRVSGWRRWVLWGWAWVVGLVPGFTGITRYLALGFPLAVWFLLKEKDSKTPAYQD